MLRSEYLSCLGLAWRDVNKEACLEEKVLLIYLKE
jgi:hypothetical protein